MNDLVVSCPGRSIFKRNVNGKTFQVTVFAPLSVLKFESSPVNSLNPRLMINANETMTIITYGA